MINKKTDFIVTFLIVFILGVFHFLTIRLGQGWGGDFSLYIAHAKNIVEHIPYSETGYLINHNLPTHSPQCYPPIYPLILSIAYYLWGFSFYFFQLITVFFLPLSLLSIYFVLKNELSSSLIWLLIIIFGLSPATSLFKDNILSDIPFLFFCYTSLIIIHQSLKQQRWYHTLLLPLSFYLCIETRSIGWTLPISFFITSIIHHKKINLNLIISIIFLIGILFIEKAWVQYHTGYTQHFQIDFKLIFQNFIFYNKALSYFWKFGFPSAFHMIFFTIFTIIATIGFFKKGFNKISVLEVFSICYLGVIAVWPAYETLRFLIPIIPLYLFYGMYIFQNHQWKFKRIFIGVGLAYLLIGYIYQYQQIGFKDNTNGIKHPDAIELFRYVDEHYNDRDILVFQKPRILSLMSHVQSVRLHEPSDTHEAIAYIQTIHATALIAKDEDSYLNHLVKTYPDYFKLVYANKMFRIYQI